VCELPIRPAPGTFAPTYTRPPPLWYYPVPNMHRRRYPFPDFFTWPPDEELISRKELAALLQVTEETVKNWYRAGLMPDRVPPPPEGILKGLPRILWRGSDLREWTLRMVGEIFKQPSRPRSTRKLEWVAGRGWVEKAPVSVAPVAPSPKPRSRRSAKVPGRHLVQLTRLEAQLARLDRLEELEADLWQTERTEVFEPEEQLPRRRVIREEPEPEPFASNIRRPTHVGYWGR
jgi:hypothetical protein